MRAFVVAYLVILLALVALPVQAQDPLEVGFHDDRDTNITYTGTWSQQSGTQFSNGTASFSSTNGDTINFQINGNTLVIFFAVHTTYNLGFNVCIDTDCTWINTDHASLTLYRVSYAFTITSSGVHDVEIQVLGVTTNFDAVMVLDSAIAESTPEPNGDTIIVVQQPTDPTENFYAVNGQVVAVQYKLTVGEALVSILVFALFVVLLLQPIAVRLKGND